MTKSNGVEGALVQIEAAINELDKAMRVAWGQERPARVDQRQICYHAGCGLEVSSYRRSDGTYGYRSEGLCDSHRAKAYREQRGAA